MKKKTTKRIAAALATVLCTIPLASSLSASASGLQNTYRIYYDAQKTGIANFEVNFTYSGDVVAEPSMKTSLCANGNFNSIHYPLSSKVVTTYQGNAITQTGTLATTKLLSSTGIDNIYDVLSFSNPVAKNANGNKMSPSSIAIDVVLVGDADNNGFIDICDVVVINSYLSNPAMNPLANSYAADANGDGSITEDDALLVQQYLAGIISHL